MRSPILKIDSKRSVRPIIIRKRDTHKQQRNLRIRDRNFETETLENLNEVLRIQKAHNSDGASSWKLEPKDSCEVHKQRIKRKSRDDQKQPRNEQGDESPEEVENRTRRDKREKRTRRKPKARRPSRKRKMRSKSEKEYLSETDLDSCCSSCQSMSFSSASESST